MNYLEVGVYVFIICLALLVIWIGREFIRARRERKERADERPEGAAAAAEELEAEELEEEAEEEAEAEAEEVEKEKEEGPEPLPAKKEAAAPAKKEAAAPAKKEAAAPAKKEAAAPAKKEAAAPAKKEAAAPAKKEAAAPAKKQEAVPEPAAAAIAEPVPKPVRPEKEKPTAEPEVERKRLRKGLKKTRNGFISKLGNLFRGKKELPPDIMDRLEEVLFTADIGVKTSERLFKSVKEALGRKELKDADSVWAHIKEESERILDVETKPIEVDDHKPFVILTIGVNGVGKTTTIGKLAAKLKEDGKKVIMAAGDTFRAAAVEQLTVWGQRVGCEVVKGKPKADPSSVVFDAIKKAEEENIDVVIADTAGRLHTKVSLMEELKKIYRVTGKAKEGAPHETWLVLDATTGQNAIQQAHLFQEAVDFTGVILTKLDGTAKGGIILGVCDELSVPVRYVGIGERVEDLRPFSPHQFVEALYAEGAEGVEADANDQ